MTTLTLPCGPPQIEAAEAKKVQLEAAQQAAQQKLAAVEVRALACVVAQQHTSLTHPLHAERGQGEGRGRSAAHRRARRGAQAPPGAQRVSRPRVLPAAAAAANAARSAEIARHAERGKLDEKEYKKARAEASKRREEAGKKELADVRVLELPIIRVLRD
jgi:hypothetical protein